MSQVVAFHLYMNDADPDRHRTACKITKREQPYLGFPAFNVKFEDGAERTAVSVQLHPAYKVHPDLVW